MLGLVGQGGRLAGVVVAGDGQDAAMPGSAEGVGVADRVHASVHSRPLAVPQAEHPVVAGAGKQVDLLAAPDGGGRQILVHPGLEVDVVLVQPGFGLPERLVQAAHGGTAVAGDEPGGVQPGFKVALALHDGKPHQRLDAGQVGAGDIQRVLVV